MTESVIVGLIVFRGTTPGFMPSVANQIATVVSGAMYEDTTVMCRTPYYAVQAVDLAGLSLASPQVTTNADSNGTFTVTFTSVINSSLLSGIEIN